MSAASLRWEIVNSFLVSEGTRIRTKFSGQTNHLIVEFFFDGHYKLHFLLRNDIGK